MSNSAVLDAASAPSLATLLEQLSRLEQAAQHSPTAIESARVNTLVHELTSHLPPSPSPSLADLFADVGYDIVHSLLPLVSPDLIRTAAVKDVADSVLSCAVLYGSPREVFLPLLSHLSAHVTPLAQQEEEKQQQQQQQQQHIDELKQQPTVEQPSIPYVSFLLPYFVCLLQREKHAARQVSMFKSLSSLLAAFFTAAPTDEALIALLSPLQPILRVDNEAHVGLLLSLLASYLPPHYPQPLLLPSPAFTLLLSLLPDTAASTTFNLVTLTSYLQRRQSLSQQLSTMRQQSWELTEDEEHITRVQHQSWHAADDEADDDDEDDEQDEQERQRRGELRHTKAQLAALPSYPPAGVVCLVLLKLVATDKREVERLVTSEKGGVAGLRVYVDAMLGTDMAGAHRQLMIDFLHQWLSLLSPQSVQFTFMTSTPAIGELARDDSWMLAECITTLMMQPSPSPPTARPSNSAITAAATTSAASLLPLYLSRFTAASRFTLTAALIPACPFPPIQAILVSTLKELLLPQSTTTEQQQQQRETMAAVVDLLLSLLAEWSDASAVLERVDGLMAVLNMLRFVVLHSGAGAAQSLDSGRRQQIVAAVRLMQQRVGQAEERESEQAKKTIDLPLLLLKDLTIRVLELS